MSKWVMFDIETLGLKPGAVVVSLGACRFNEIDEPTDKMALLLDMSQQEARGARIELGTVTWWLQQSDAARNWNFNTSNRYPVDVALRAFATFCQGAELFWSRGSFDANHLESLCGMFNLDVPWKYNQLRDARSLDELTDAHPATAGTIAHKPLDDCLMQVAAVQSCFQQPPKVEGLNLKSTEAFADQEGDAQPTRLVPRR